MHFQFICLSVFTIFLNFSMVAMNELRTVCYVDSTSIDVRKEDSFNAELIDVNICTHIIYAFAGINTSSYKLKSANDKHFKEFEAFNKLKRKNPNLKILISVGGSNTSPKLTEMVMDVSSRREFVDSAVKFVGDNGFDGLDIAWKYPKAMKMAEMDSSAEGRNRVLLAEELKRAMQKEWTLSYSIAAEFALINEGFDLKSLSKSVDFFLIQCFNYYRNELDQIVRHNSPLYGYPNNTQNVNHTVHTILKETGISKDKIVVGIPMFGRSEDLENKGSVNDETNLKPYNKLCKENGWDLMRDNYRMVPYMYNKKQWMSYEDPKSVYEKAKFVREHKLGGIMVWSLDQDDFTGKCSNKTKFPLMDAILKGLGKRSVTPDLDPKLFKSSAVHVCSSTALLFISFVFLRILLIF